MGVQCLSQAQVVEYLLENKLLDPSDIGDCLILVRDASRRNSNVKVVREGGPSYFVKQSLERNALETLANEAGIYRLFHGDYRFRALSSYLPGYYCYDSTKNLLVVESLTRDAEDLERYHLRGYFSRRIAQEIARGLAQLHSLCRLHLRDRWSLNQGDRGLPWVFTLHRPSINQARDLSVASSEIVGIIQRHHEFNEMIDRCAGYWEPATIIHGDIKWGNFVVFSPSGSGRKTRLKIIDWEYAGVGDPCWDLGSVFGAYMSCWVLSMAITSAEASLEWEGNCRFPLEAMQPAIRDFWREYARCMKLDQLQREIWLWRSTLYSAMRLVQTIIERLQQTNVVNKNVAHLLQLAMNTLAHPEETIVHVLGISLKG